MILNILKAKMIKGNQVFLSFLPLHTHIFIVRSKAKNVIELLEDPQKLEEERKYTKELR